MKLRCSVPDCTKEFSTTDNVSEGARYICKEHPRPIQLKAIGRVYDPETDDDDLALHFQSFQFDRKLDNLPEIDVENLSLEDELWA